MSAAREARLLEAARKAGDPFAEYRRMEREWDDRFARLAEDHAAFVARQDAALARNGVRP